MRSARQPPTRRFPSYLPGLLRQRPSQDRHLVHAACRAVVARTTVTTATDHDPRSLNSWTPGRTDAVTAGARLTSPARATTRQCAPWGESPSRLYAAKGLKRP